ncbi:MAG TPA: thioredoxin family protein [Saprospiraceae bacterium]|nr:thioredoxin family protein [Saprospiraceae bacterium]HMQ81464.1 thioredoxin family protein [Saprospiraceae bacterium]
MLQIKILGMGDSSFQTLKKNLLEALESSAMTYELQEVKDIDAFLRYDLHSIPSIVINDKVFFQNSHIPDTFELIERLESMPSEQVIYS